jgi:hypothetical protein
VARTASATFGLFSSTSLIDSDLFLEHLQEQRRARFSDPATTDQWLTSTNVPTSINAFSSKKDGSLGVFNSAHTLTLFDDDSEQGGTITALRRWYPGFAIQFPEGHNSEIRVGDKRLVINKCRQKSALRRTIYGRAVRVVVLDVVQGENEEVPICEVSVPVLPDGASATRWDDFRAMVCAKAGTWVDTTSFTYIPASATRSTYLPWCLKIAPDIHISHVEDEIEQGVSAYSLKLGLYRLERLATHINLGVNSGGKDRTGYPVLLELTLINEEIQVYTDDKKRDNLCKLLSDAIGQSVKIVIKPKEQKAGEKPKQAPAKQKSKQKENDSAVLEAGKCEIAEAIELRQLGTRSSLHGVWMVLRYIVESPEHATAFVSQLCQPEVLQLLEEAITHKMWTTPEEKSRRAREPKRTPVWARLNKQAPAWSSVASINAELQMLRGLAHRYPHFELFRWKGMFLRYKGPHLWAQRHYQDDGEHRPYFYLDHVTEHTLYCSLGILHVENDADFKEAVQNVVHREAFASSATGDLVLYLTTAKRFTLVVQSAVKGLALDCNLSFREDGVRVPISIDSTFEEARAALRKALGGVRVFFSYVYKAEIHLNFEVSMLTDNEPLYEEYEQDLFEAVRELMGLSREEWKSKSRVKRHQREDSLQYFNLLLRIRDIPIWKAENMRQSFCGLDKMQAEEGPISYAVANITPFHDALDVGEEKDSGTDKIIAAAYVYKEQVERRQFEWVKSRILDCIQTRLGNTDTNFGSAGFHRANLRLLSLPAIEAPRKLVDHPEEFNDAVKILSQDPALQRTLSVQVQGEYRLICFCSMTQAKQTRVLEAQRRLHEAEDALKTFEKSLEESENHDTRVPSRVEKSSSPQQGANAQQTQKSCDAQQSEGPSQSSASSAQLLFGAAPAPPATLVWGVWGSWKPVFTPPFRFRPDLFFEDDEHACIEWASIRSIDVRRSPLPFVFRQWFQVENIFPIRELRKVGTTPIEWYAVPYVDMKTWVNAKKLLDSTWREQQQLAAPSKTGSGVPEGAAVQSTASKKSSYLGFLNRKVAVSEDTGPTKSTRIAVQAILVLVNTSCVEAVETLWMAAAPGARVPQRIEDSDLLRLPAAGVQELLEVVIRNWLDINVNIQYIWARQFIERHSSQDTTQEPKKAKGGSNESRNPAKERWNAKHLSDLRVAVQEQKVRLGKCQVELSSTTSGEVFLMPAVGGVGGPSKFERKLDLISIPWDCSWYTMQNRMQVLTGHNNDSLIFVFRTDVDVDLSAAHDISASIHEDSQRNDFKSKHSRHWKLIKGADLLDLERAIYSAPATGQALKSHPRVDICKVEKEMIKYSDILLLNRSGKGTASTGDVLFMMQRVSRAMVNDDNVYVWKQGVEDGADWVLLLFQGQFPWQQRTRGTYAYLDIFTKEVLYVHRYIIFTKRFV